MAPETFFFFLINKVSIGGNQKVFVCLFVCLWMSYRYDTVFSHFGLPPSKEAERALEMESLAWSPY